MSMPCAGAPALFFSFDYEDKALARTICETCPYRPTCLRRALATGETEGIWGGYDPTERGFYKRLYGLPSVAVVDLPQRYREKAPLAKRRQGAA